MQTTFSAIEYFSPIASDNLFPYFHAATKTLRFRRVVCLRVLELRLRVTLLRVVQFSIPKPIVVSAAAIVSGR